MLKAQDVLHLLQEKGINFFAGVPDSALKDFLLCLNSESSADHIIAANEGNAVALAAGHYLATGETGMVYMQNSGLGNSVNPLVSLVDKDVYQIPVLLMIGWRGEPGLNDEPQHLTQGRITEEMLNVLGIPYAILPSEQDLLADVLDKAVAFMKEHSSAYALLVRNKTFEPFDGIQSADSADRLTREAAIKAVADIVSKDDVIVSTTGKASRELFEYRDQMKKGHHQDFLNVGSMGHASQIAFGVARQHQGKTVYCLDGDGAVLMHMGALAVIGTQKPSNFVHVVLNNGVHDSVGGQPTAAGGIDLCAMALACGYSSAVLAEDSHGVREALKSFLLGRGPFFLEVRVCPGSRKDLGRPALSPVEIKKLFMKHLEEH